MHAYEPIDNIDGLFGHDEFHGRHLGPNQATEAQMLQKIGAASRQQLIQETVPAAILKNDLLKLPEPATEADALAELKAIAGQNEIWRSFIGAGYHGTFTPEPIRRNVLENPGWYTAYTPYQAEVAQGRLEALMNFQQMVVDLTGMHTSNASLLDEATAAAEAMATMKRACKVANANKFFIDQWVHPQVIAVMRTRAEWMGIDVVIGDANTFAPTNEFYGAHVQTPDTRGEIRDFTTLAQTLHAQGARLCIGSDLLSLMLVKSPGAMGADVAIGSAQRLGIPMGYGGPHAAFMAVKEDLVRMMPGRIIGVSIDASGKPAYRMSLQTREQHIRRDKATSNICTAQALLANMASFFAVYHGPEGLHRIALRANAMARLVVKASGLTPVQSQFFDTVTFAAATIAAVKGGLSGVQSRAAERKINLRYFENCDVGLACDETTSLSDVTDLVYVLTGNTTTVDALKSLKLTTQPESIPSALLRNDPVLTHPVFNSYHSETDFMRYMKRLENKDISLVHSMIPLGSCTMKLNAAAEMAPVTWPEFAALHPFAPSTQAKGYAQMLSQLSNWLAEITGFDAVSFQPNSGAQGEYAGLLAIRFYQESIGQGHRDVCLIPSSAHGTNPASAQMMGMKIVVVACDSQGNVDVADLKAKIDAHRDQLSALMVTYPSTHGVFESAIKDICKMVHDAGGQVYMDGANLNAQAGLTRPGDIGADVCHMNLHKTFCIPHGGGGPGMGPIAVAKHLAPYLSVDPYQAGNRNLKATTDKGAARNQIANSVSAAPFGSALITTISWVYIRMMGASGIRKATELAILNANYVAARLENYFPILYKGENGRIAHECILDLRNLKSEYGVTAEDIAKRLMDYGFHAPTLSFPVVDTLMVEPTESESKAELDRFCDAMITIHGEIQKVKSGEFDATDNPLKCAPHTAQEIAGEWAHGYSRETAAFPLPWVRGAKFWPTVKRIDNAAGDRNLVCTCPPVAEYA